MERYKSYASKISYTSALVTFIYTTRVGVNSYKQASTFKKEKKRKEIEH